MLIRSLVSALAACLLLGACASTTKSEAAPMSPDEMMAAWAKYSTPGEHHKKLDPMAGSFRATVRSRMDPNQPWEESTGTCENRWTMGNRFLESTFRGSFMNTPFEGRGYVGYDNSTGKYNGIWFDNMGTGLMPPSVGTVDSTGKVFTYLRECKDPISGAWMKTRDVTTIKSSNEHVMEMFMQSGDGPEYQSMTITFTRM